MLIPSEVYQGKSWHCQSCDLIFKDPSEYWDWEKQKYRYDQHNNDIESPGYVQYFEKLLHHLRPLMLEKNITEGLDWGSGPSPVLQKLLKRNNIHLDIYDPIYQPSKEVLKSMYPLLTCTEVMEHMTNPRRDLLTLNGYLMDGGIFAGMTRQHRGPEHYLNWWYVKDPTHVCFYSEMTMNWISRFLNYRLEILKDPVFIFIKEST